MANLRNARFASIFWVLILCLLEQAYCVEYSPLCQSELRLKDKSAQELDKCLEKNSEKEIDIGRACTPFFETYAEAFQSLKKCMMKANVLKENK